MQMYEVTSFAIEVLRTAIEIQLEKQIRLGEHDTYCGGLRRHKDNGHDWESKYQFINGMVVSVDGRDIYSLTARIEINSYTGVWRSDRVFFELTYNGMLVRFVAHSEYRNEPKVRSEIKVEYPDFMCTTAEHTSLANNDKWRVGRTFNDVKKFSDIEWHPIMNTYIHP